MLRRFAFLLCCLALLVGAQAATATTPAPSPDAAAFVLVNAATGETLAGRQPDRELAMASTTKIMTALIVLDRADLDARYRVPADAVVGGSTAGLQAGETLTVRDLLTGLLVSSGNDASITLAEGLAGSQDAFVAMMNARARDLGLSHTAYRNPHGLDEPGHHTSVRDLVRLSQVAMRDPLFRQIVADRRATIPGVNGVGTRTLESENLLLDAYPEADGIKTGMTDDAGYSLVAHARRPGLGMSLYLAMIGSPSSEVRASDAEALLRWGFAQYARPTIVPPGAVVGSAPVQYRPGVSVPYRVDRGIRVPIRLGEDVTEEIAAPREVEGPVEEGDVLGTLTLRQGERVLARRDLVAAASAGDAGVMDRIGAGFRALIP